MHPPVLDRRRFLLALPLSFLLASCATDRAAGPGGGASASVAATLARLRSGEGLARLSPDSALEKAALEQAGFMAGSGRMNHTTRWGRDFASRMKQDGINGIRAENIAYGAFDADKVVAVWMGSPPHRRNMLDPRFTRFGLAWVGDGNGRRYWAMVLAS
jgi:uncharacterized protein YkwD